MTCCLLFWTLSLSLSLSLFLYILTCLFVHRLNVCLFLLCGVENVCAIANETPWKHEPNEMSFTSDRGYVHETWAHNPQLSPDCIPIQSDLSEMLFEKEKKTLERCFIFCVYIGFNALEYSAGKRGPMYGSAFDVTHISYMNTICAKHAYYKMKRRKQTATLTASTTNEIEPFMPWNIPLHAYIW